MEQFPSLSRRVYLKRQSLGVTPEAHLLSDCSSRCTWVAGLNDVHVCLLSGNVHFCGKECTGAHAVTRAGERICSLTGQILSGPALVFQEDAKTVQQSGHTHVVDLTHARQSLTERRTKVEQLRECVARFMQLARATCEELVSSSRRKRLDASIEVKRAENRSQAYQRTVGRAALHPKKGLGIGVMEVIAVIQADIASDRAMARTRANASAIKEHFARASVFYWMRCATAESFPFSHATYGFVDHFCALLFKSSERSQRLVPIWPCLTGVFPRQADVVDMLLDNRRGMVTKCGESLRKFLVTTDATLTYLAPPWTDEWSASAPHLPDDKDKFEAALAKLFVDRVDPAKLTPLVRSTNK